MNRDNHEIPDLFIEKYALGEASDDEIKAILKRMDQKSLDERVERLFRDNKRILSNYPFANSGLKPTENELKSRIQWDIKVLFPLAAAFCMIIFLPRLWQHQNDDILLKSDGPKIYVSIKKHGKISQLKDQDTVSAGDLVELQYGPSGMNYGVILSLDGNGAVTQHFPESGNISEKLGKKSRVRLGHSYELDDAPSFESFYFISSISTFEISDFRSKLTGQKKPIPVGELKKEVSDQIYIDLFTLKKVKR
ncbi:MAG: hypothetical protein HRU19_16540 [Pseudobacteriovorax sp.]|nr:hypothetical protein [Pseudobacteriovorax sp.]